MGPTFLQFCVFISQIWVRQINGFNHSLFFIFPNFSFLWRKRNSTTLLSLLLKITLQWRFLLLLLHLYASTTHDCPQLDRFLLLRRVSSQSLTSPLAPSFPPIDDLSFLPLVIASDSLLSACVILKVHIYWWSWSPASSWLPRFLTGLWVMSTCAVLWSRNRGILFSVELSSESVIVISWSELCLIDFRLYIFGNKFWSYNVRRKTLYSVYLSPMANCFLFIDLDHECRSSGALLLLM